MRCARWSPPATREQRRGGSGQRIRLLAADQLATLSLNEHDS